MAKGVTVAFVLSILGAVVLMVYPEGHLAFCTVR